MITDEQLKEWRELAEKAEAGPWRRDERYTADWSLPVEPVRDPDDGIVFEVPYPDWDTSKANTNFCIAARQAVPALLDEVDRLRAELESETKWADEYHREAEKLRAELEAAKEANRWIPVTERMPEHWRPVLMQTTTGNIYGARYHESAHQWTTDCGLYFHGESLKQVVFWRPFPEPQETSEA